MKNALVITCLFVLSSINVFALGHRENCATKFDRWHFHYHRSGGRPYCRLFDWLSDEKIKLSLSHTNQQRYDVPFVLAA